MKNLIPLVLIAVIICSGEVVEENCKPITESGEYISGGKSGVAQPMRCSVECVKIISGPLLDSINSKSKGEA